MPDEIDILLAFAEVISRSPSTSCASARSIGSVRTELASTALRGPAIPNSSDAVPFFLIRDELQGVGAIVLCEADLKPIAFRIPCRDRPLVIGGRGAEQIGIVMAFA